MDLRTKIRRGHVGLNRRWRELRVILKGLSDTDHPLLAHLIPTRRCNLSCTYCNEYDSVSDPVPLENLCQRVDRLAELGTSIITMSGGEPMLHPELDDVLRRVRRHGIIASLITNGYFLTAERIQQLNDAGLEYLQISIDNVHPDDVSMKSLKVLDKKLLLLSKYADFHVNINSVLGGGIKNAQDALAVAERSRELGFMSTVGVIHGSGGQLSSMTAQEHRIYRQIRSMSKQSYGRMVSFQDNIATGKSNKWWCRAGGRYLYVCEDGLVHYCSQQRGYPGVPLENYTLDHIREGYSSVKPCAPFCTVSCVHKVSTIDFWRDPQNRVPAGFKPTGLGV